MLVIWLLRVFVLEPTLLDWLNYWLVVTYIIASLLWVASVNGSSLLRCGVQQSECVFDRHYDFLTQLVSIFLPDYRCLSKIPFFSICIFYLFVYFLTWSLMVNLFFCFWLLSFYCLMVFLNYWFPYRHVFLFIFSWLNTFSFNFSSSLPVTECC